MNRVLLRLIPVAALGALAIGCSRNADEAADGNHASSPALIEVELTTVGRSDVSAVLEQVGSLLSRRRSIIVSEVDGVIAKIMPPSRNAVLLEADGEQRPLPLDIGSEVAASDVLIKLDASEYQRALIVAEAQLKKTQADLAELKAWKRPEEVERLEALFDEAKAMFERAESEAKRTEQLNKRNAITQSEYEERVMQARRARALLAHAKANLDIAKAGPTSEAVAVAEAVVAAAEAAVDQKRWKVEKTTIRAPYDAVITDRYVDVGDRVTALPRVEILELMDIGFLVAEVGVPEQYSGKIHNGDRATVRVQGTADGLPGTVIRVNGKVDPGSRTFRIRVMVNNDERRLRVGQFARVNLNIATSSNALTLPQAAVVYEGGESRVFVYTNGQVQARTVSLGIINGESVEVLDGLEEGEQIVVDDPAVLSDGMAVNRRVPRTVAQAAGASTDR